MSSKRQITTSRSAKYECQTENLIKTVDIRGLWTQQLLGDATKMEHILESVKRADRFEFPSFSFLFVCLIVENNKGENPGHVE